MKRLTILAIITSVGLLFAPASVIGQGPPNGIDVNVVNEPVVKAKQEGNWNVTLPNPGLPQHPIFAFKNAEHGSNPILFGPYSSQVKIAIGSLTFDGGNDTWGTQVKLVITNCENITIDHVSAFMVMNNAAGLGPQHMTFPVPLVLPVVDPGGDWCLQVYPTLEDQILITAVGYVIE